MRIGEFPFRDIRGVQVRDLPVTRRDSVGGFAVSALYALDYLRAGQEAPLNEDWTVVLSSLEEAVRAVEEVDLLLLVDGDPIHEAAVSCIAEKVARWHDALWYPRGEALIDSFMQAHPRAITPAEQGHYQVIGFAEEAPKWMAAWGATCHASQDEQEQAAIMEGLSSREAMNSPELAEAIRRAEVAREEAAQQAEHLSVAELAASLQTASPGPQA